MLHNSEKVKTFGYVMIGRNDDVSNTWDMFLAKVIHLTDTERYTYMNISFICTVHKEYFMCESYKEHNAPCFVIFVTFTEHNCIYSIFISLLRVLIAF